MNEFQYTGTDESALETAKRRIAEKDAEYQLQQAFANSPEAQKLTAIAAVDEPQVTPKKAVRKVGVISPLGLSDEQFLAKYNQPQAQPAVVPTVLPNGLVVGSAAELMRRTDRQPIFSKPQQSPEMLAEEALAEKNYQAVRPLPPEGSVAGLMQRDQTAIEYPKFNFMDMLKSWFNPKEFNEKTKWNSVKNYTPK